MMTKTHSLLTAETCASILSTMSSMSNPSSSSPPNQPNKKKHKTDLIHQTNKTQFPNWLELLPDIWFLIFSKLLTIEIIEDVQKVCMLFRKICKQPALFRTINMTVPTDRHYRDLPWALYNMTRYAIDSSAGGLIDINLGYRPHYFYPDIAYMTLTHITERCKNLKHLRLGYLYHSSLPDEGLIEAVKKLPMLEEIQMTHLSLSEKTVEAIGYGCPSLTSFGLNGVCSKLPDYICKNVYYKCRDQDCVCNNKDFFICNDVALAISKSMPNLRHLQLIGNEMDNQGLKAILDGCPHLKSLDLRSCLNIDLERDLGKRLANMQVQYPDYDTDDVGYESCRIHDPGHSDYSSGYNSFLSDSDDDWVISSYVE